MYNVYVPYDDITSFSNYYYSDDFNLIYATNDNINFDVIDVNNHYSIVNTNLDISDYNLISINNDNLTNNWTYRTDLFDVLFCLLIFVIFFFGIPLLILSKLFKRKLF